MSTMPSSMPSATSRRRRACPASGPARRRPPRCARGSATRRSSRRRSTATSAAGTGARSTRPASSRSIAPPSTTTCRPSRASPGRSRPRSPSRRARRCPKKLVLEAPRHDVELPPGAVEERLERMRNLAVQLEPVERRRRRDGHGRADRLRLDGERQEGARRLCHRLPGRARHRPPAGRPRGGDRRHAGGRDARGDDRAARRGRQEVRRQGGALHDHAEGAEAPHPARARRLVREGRVRVRDAGRAAGRHRAPDPRARRAGRRGRVPQRRADRAGRGRRRSRSRP